MDCENIKIESIIKRIRDSFDESVVVYTQGSCVKFCMILKEIFPSGKILYNSDHAIFELNGLCYDVNGIAEKTNHIELTKYGILKCYDIMQLKYNK